MAVTPEDSSPSPFPSQEQCLKAISETAREDYEAVVLGNKAPSEQACDRGVYTSTVVTNVERGKDAVQQAISEHVAGESGPSSQYPVHVVPVGGRERDGSPTYLGRWTFDCRPVKKRVQSHLHGRVLNSTAGKTRLDYQGGEIVTNDINPDIKTDYTEDVVHLDQTFPSKSFGSVIFDPPFDSDEAEKVYEGWHASDYAAAREALATLVKPGGTLIEFGWNSHGIATAADGWSRDVLYLFQRGPNRPDVFMTVDRKFQLTLFDSLS